MKPSAKVSLIGISLISRMLLGTAITLMVSSEAKADKQASLYVTQSATHTSGDYLPSHFYDEQFVAKEQDLPAQF
jgi:hypothetical protein